VNAGSDAPSTKVGDDAREELPNTPLPIRLVSNTAVTRPVPAQQRTHPRDFEITQIKRRFSPTVKEDDHASILIFKLVPSDPDFPFELDGLRIALTVPHAYPSNGSPTIRIDNPEMERGYQINVEKGFDELVANYPTKTLLALMNELDKNLESFLISEKAKTVKLVANADKAPMQYPQRAPPPAIPHESSIPASSPKLVQYTPQQREEARLKREANVRQIEARMGRQPLYSQSSDGTTFNIPLQIPQLVRLPTSLQAIKDVRLLLPQLYPLESCNIRLREGSKEAEFVEMAFERHAKEHPELTLMAHINHLVQNMHHMSREVVTVQEPRVSKPQTTQPVIVENEATSTKDQPRIFDTDRPHVQLIPRPPEWDLAPTESDDDDESDYTGSDMSQSDVEGEAGGAQLGQSEQVAAPGPERGILLSFPMLELYSIELLQVSSISLTIKCDRCKDTMDVMGIKPATTEGGISRNVESCKKCSSSLSVAYRAEPMHMNSIRAGFLDLEGCTVVDLLPSHFQPTCSECSTTFAKPGVVSVRGETSMAVCRECHKKMTFKLPEVKFLRVSSAERPNRPLPRKKPKENLGIQAGTELPRKGRCQHYAKSYRWFRFSCCQKVYACDRCHDAAEEHPNEHANRMICGLCSREQHYRPEDCGFCHSGLVGKKSGGFWGGYPKEHISTPFSLRGYVSVTRGLVSSLSTSH
jgi:uncharacterized CHY-type Zn-finger protein